MHRQLLNIDIQKWRNYKELTRWAEEHKQNLISYSMFDFWASCTTHIGINILLDKAFSSPNLSRKNMDTQVFFCTQLARKHGQANFSADNFCSRNNNTGVLMYAKGT